MCGHENCLFHAKASAQENWELSNPGVDPWSFPMDYGQGTGDAPMYWEQWDALMDEWAKMYLSEGTVECHQA